MASFETPTTLEGIIALRLDLTQRERLLVKEALDGVDARLNRARSVLSQCECPRETEHELDMTTAQMERHHATTAWQTLESERDFLRELQKLRERKKWVAEYNQLQQSFEELKVQRATLRKDLTDKDVQLEELFVGSRKIKLATRIGCSPAEVLEQKVSVPENKMAQIIGKGGVNLKQVEDTCKVMIEADRHGGTTLRITGTGQGITAAHEAIFNIVSVVTEEFSPPDAIIVSLILDKAALAREIELRYSVRIDISRARRMCKISGTPEAIHAAVAEIQTIDAARVQIPIDVSVLPFIVGKGGATIRALGETGRVQLDIDREENLIVILGYRADVDRAVVTLRGIIDEYSEIEETIVADKQTMIGCIIGSGGQHIRSLQKEFNVQMRTERGADDGEPDKLVLRGTGSRVMVAAAKVNEMLAAYRASSDVIEMPDEVISLIVGKKGARIAALREKFPDATIDVEAGGCVRVQSNNAATRQAVLDAVDALVSSNYVLTLALEFDMGVLMKGPRGSEARTMLTTDLSLGFDILPEEGCVKLRGSKRNVDKGVEIVEAFVRNNYFVDIPCSEDDFSTVFAQATEAKDPALKVRSAPLKTAVALCFFDIPYPSRLKKGARDAVSRGAAHEPQGGHTAHPRGADGSRGGARGTGRVAQRRPEAVVADVRRAPTDLSIHYRQERRHAETPGKGFGGED